MVLILEKIKVKDIVKGVSLEVREGEIKVLLGRNGAGKTTLARAIMGLVSYEGNIYFEGRNINKLKPHERVKQGITFILQNLPNLPQITVKRLFYAINLDDNLINKYLNVFHLPKDILDKKIDYKEISGGERKKVEVISALLLNPKIMILDEVDAGLDIKSKKILANKLKDNTALVITHDVEFAKIIGKSIAIMENGKIIKEGGKEVIEDYVGTY